MIRSKGSRSLTMSIAACLASAISLAAPVFANDLTEREELQRGDNDPDGKMETIMGKIRMMPGAHIPLHTHPGDEFVYVVTGGAIETHQGKLVEFPTGMSARFARGQVHGGVTSRADGEIVLLTVHVVDKGKPVFEYLE